MPTRTKPSARIWKVQGAAPGCRRVSCDAVSFHPVEHWMQGASLVPPRSSGFPVRGINCDYEVVRQNLHWGVVSVHS
jgi:hypothetical protein